MDLDELTAGGPWRILEERGPAEVLHADAARDLQAGAVTRTLRLSVAERAALVLGSHQSASSFDPVALEEHGVDLARRRSGGSAVLVGPGRVLWADFLVPAGDPLWHDDVGRAAWWVGELWATAIGAGEVWRGPMRTTTWSSVVCFAGLGPGEVTIDGRKVVGVCQRRTRRGALFQTAALLDWDPGEYLALLADGVEVSGGADRSGLDRVATGLGTDREDSLRRAVLGLLST